MASKRSRIKRIAKDSDAPVVGVAVTITSERNTHAGIVYRDADDGIRLLHLAWHYDLRDEEFDQTYLCVVPKLEKEDAEAVAGHCRLIASNQPTIAFAIHYNPKAALQEVGERVLLLREGKGLNCSTFVLTVFNKAGPGLVSMVGWEKRDSDRGWQKHLVTCLKRRGAPMQHVKRVANDIGCARVRPEEVAGACMENDLPATFHQCEPNGQEVLTALTRHTGRPVRTQW